MKKIISFILCLIFVLCLTSCSEEAAEPELVIPFQKIAATNKRTKILEKYGSIIERTASKAEGSSNFTYWIMYYEKDGENINAILDYSDAYKCYYYNNQVYAKYEDGFMRKVLTYRENYDAILNELMARSDTLSYVYISNQSAREGKDKDTGEKEYIATYEFKVNNDNIVDLEGLGINVGDTVEVEYDLTEDLIIKSCRYNLVKDDSKKMVAHINVTYGEKIEFPEEVTGQSENVEDFVDVTVVENFGTGAQYSETFRIEKGGRVAENDVLQKYYLFKDPIYRTEFVALEEILNENVELFIVEASYIDNLRAMEEHENKVIEEYYNKQNETTQDD